MAEARHSFFDNKVQLFRRPKSPYWWASCTIDGKQKRTTTHEDGLPQAKDIARDWYLTLLGKYQQGELIPRGSIQRGKKFREASAKFIEEFEAITQGERSPVYVQGHKSRIKNHLDPYFGDMALANINEGTVQEYRIHRMKNGLSRKDQFTAAKHDPKSGEFNRSKPPARTTLHQEIVCLRQILNTANRHGWLKQVPLLKAPYKASGKIAHRAWFSPPEYKSLYELTRKWAQNPPKSEGAVRFPKKSHQWAFEQLHDLILFDGNTGLRPDELLNLQFRDVEIVDDRATGRTILEISVRGKRGVGYCKSLPGAVEPFRRLQKRRRPTRVQLEAKADNEKGPTWRYEFAETKPTDFIFPKTHHDLFDLAVKKLDLKVDREGNARTIYSLRHTYVCMRLMEGADIYQIAKNCRTSVEMIEKYYASHIKDRLDASAINVRKSRWRAKSTKLKGQKA
jgi:integrase